MKMIHFTAKLFATHRDQYGGGNKPIFSGEFTTEFTEEMVTTLVNHGEFYYKEIPLRRGDSHLRIKDGVFEIEMHGSVPYHGPCMFSKLVEDGWIPDQAEIDKYPPLVSDCECSKKKPKSAK